MAITEQQVIRAAERLTERGERPTNARIRAELGGEGSYSTINKYMQQWREAQAPEPEPELSEPEPREPEVPEELTAKAYKLAGELVTAAWRESDVRHAKAIEAERRALAAEYEKLELERVKYGAEIDDLDAALVRLEQQGEEAVATEQVKAEALREELAKVREQHAATREELARIEAREQAAQERLAELRDEVESSRRQVAELEQREREQRDKANADARKMGDHISEIMTSLEEWKREAAIAKAAQAEAEKRYQTELEEWCQKLDAADKAMVASDASQRAATDAVTQLQERLAGLDARLVDAKAVIERLTANKSKSKES